MNYFMVEESELYDDYFVIDIFINDKEQKGMMVHLNDFRGVMQTLNCFNYEDKSYRPAFEQYNDMVRRQCEKMFSV